MTPQLIVIRLPEEVEALRAYLKDKEYIAFDTETTGIHKGAEIIGMSFCAEEDKAYYVVVQEWNPPQNCLKARPLSFITPLCEDLVGKKLIAHNGVFDCSMVENNYQVSLIGSLHTDTMILAHLLDENRRVGLKELAASIYGEDSTLESKLMKESVIKNGGKLTKTCYEMYKADSELMAKYGAKDALLTYKLFLDLVPQLVDQGLYDFFYHDESMPLLRGPTYQLNTTGLKVDKEALTTLRKTLEAECLEAKSFIYSEIDSAVKEQYPGTNKKNIFNIGAPCQLSWLLFSRLGLEFDRLTDTGREVCKALGLKLPYTRSAKNDFIVVCQNSIGTVYESQVKQSKNLTRAKKIRAPWNYIAADKRALTKIAPKLKWVARYLEYQKNMKLLSTYVKGIEAKMQYGVIRPSFLQHGTTSGRYSSREPNFQNLPRDDRRVKKCIIARPGKVFVGADYSQLEPRVFAYFSQDKRLMESFKDRLDFYSVVGIEVNGKFECVPLKEGPDNAFGKCYPKLRQDAKTFTLASTYGATGYQLSPLMNKPAELAQQDIDKYFEAFPSVRQMMLDSHKMAKTDGRVINLFGRPRRMPEAKRITKLYGNIPHHDLPYAARNMLNLACNFRIQSTGASIVNRAAIKFYDNCKKANIAANIVCQVHDSLIAECKESDAETVSLLLQDAMENATILSGVSLEAFPKTGRTLADV